MPSTEHAADLERVLSRAVEECESVRGIWFGQGLPQLLRGAIEARGGAANRGPVELAFVEVSAISPQGRASTPGELPSATCRVIGLSTTGLEGLSSLFRSTGVSGVEIARLICPVAVFDFSQDVIRVREIRHGLTAADLQRRLPTRLWSGPDLKELGTHQASPRGR
jgi:hypothetical protein